MRQINWPIAAAQTYGGVLINADGELLLRSPANHFDGYVWTFAKGKPDHLEQPADTALREVYEETGYRAEIIGVLPGIYQSGHSSAAFFVMRAAAQQPASFGNETEAIAWCSFSKAKAYVALSTNTLGRQRDLAIIAAAEAWFLACLPLALLGRFPTLASDWNIQPLTPNHSKIALNLNFSRQQMAKLMLGFAPEEMEQKWFSYFADNVLYQHRSWRGICIDQIFFQEQPNGSFKATHALVNRDPAEYAETDDAADKKRIRGMLDDLLIADD